MEENTNPQPKSRKEELFEKYGISETHNQWSESIDQYIQTEIFRLLHGGRLPYGTEKSKKWILDFLDQMDKAEDFYNDIVKNLPQWQTYYVTAQRFVYKFADELLVELNTEETNSAIES